MSVRETFPSPGIVPSLKRTIKNLPLTQQIAILKHVVEAEDFADFDTDALHKIDAGLTACMERSLADDAAEQERVFGREVMA